MRTDVRKLDEREGQVRTDARRLEGVDVTR